MTANIFIKNSERCNIIDSPLCVGKQTAYHSVHTLAAVRDIQMSCERLDPSFASLHCNRHRGHLPSGTQLSVSAIERNSKRVINPLTPRNFAGKRSLRASSRARVLVFLGGGGGGGKGARALAPSHLPLLQTLNPRAHSQA